MIVEEGDNSTLAEKIISKYKLLRMGVPEDDVAQEVFCSLFLSALRWDAKRGTPFEAYAIKSAKECRHRLRQLNATIRLNLAMESRANRFLRTKIDNWDCTIGTFARKNNLSSEHADALGDAVTAISANKCITQNRFPELPQKRGETPGNPGETPEYGYARRRVREIMWELLPKEQLEAICLHFGINSESAPMTFLAIRKELGIPLNTVKSRYRLGINKLLNSQYKNELHALFKTLSEYSTG
jgi:DNA-directed RNA polymerase specialized sigma24 family protein